MLLMPMLHAETATQKNLLFEHLLRATKQAIFDSMTPLEVPAGTSIIKQGDADAKTFYVLASGSCEVLLQSPDSGSEARQVLTYEPGRYPLLCTNKHNKYGPYRLCRTTQGVSSVVCTDGVLSHCSYSLMRLDLHWLQQKGLLDVPPGSAVCPALFTCI